MPLWSDSPVVIVLSIVGAIGFLAGCMLRDELVRRRAERRAVR